MVFHLLDLMIVGVSYVKCLISPTVMYAKRMLKFGIEAEAISVTEIEQILGIWVCTSHAYGLISVIINCSDC